MAPPQVAQSPYELHRGYVLGVLRRRCGWLDADEREAIFHDAYAVLLEKERDGELEPEAMHPHQLRAYLVQSAIYKALDEGKRAERNRTEPLGEGAFTTPDPEAPPEDMAAASLESARLREIVEELPERRQTIVKLRFYFDRTPVEIQQYLNISSRVYRRELERAMRYLSERYELLASGQFCESRRSLILAYVAGIAGPNRARDARVHLANCPGCSAWAAELRESARQAAALLPLPAVAAEGGLDRLTAMAADLFTGAKQQLAMLAGRVDPSSAGYATAARPGSAAAAIAGCLAVGAGATYCMTEGIPDPVGSIFRGSGVEVAEGRQDKPRPRPERTRSPAAHQVQEQPPVPKLVAPVRRVTPQAAKPRRPARPRSTPTPVASPEAVEQEFGFEAADPPPAAPATAQAPAPAQQPQPQPQPLPQPPGEFDP